MKSFIALSCLLVVASASPQYNSFGYKFLSDGKSATKSAYAPATKSAYAPATNSVYAPAVKSNSYSSGNGFNWNWGSLMEYVNDPWLGLEKAQELLEELNKDLPDALAKMDPSLKNDIKQVNGLVLEICAKAVANARPSTITSYYSPSSMKKTCDFINKHVPEISRGLDEPEVISNLIGKVRKFGSLAKQMNDLLE